MSNHQLFRVVTSAVIYNEEGKFLVAQRHSQDDSLPNFWSIPAGHVEIDQNGIDVLEANLKREIKEEIGVEINIKQYLDSNGWVDPEYKKVIIAFLCTIKSGTPKPLEDTQDVKWLTLSEIEKLNLPPNVLRVITKASEILNCPIDLK